MLWQKGHNSQSGIITSLRERHFRERHLKKDLGKGEKLTFSSFPKCFVLVKENLPDLTLSQTTNFGLSQTERVCRRQL